MSQNTVAEVHWLRLARVSGSRMLLSAGRRKPERRYRHSMKTLPRTGLFGEARFVMKQQHAIDFADDVMPMVLCTPWLIWFLEHAARNALLPLLEVGESTVGTEIEVQHSAATPVGQAVVCTARVVRAEGNEVWFQLEARDEAELIAKGFHKLHVISKSRFASRVERKRSSR